MSELLDVPSELDQMSDEDLQKFYKQLLLSEGNNPEGAPAEGQIPDKGFNTIQPTPGLCIKTKNLNNGEKIFVNVCTSSSVPSPDSITEQELLLMLDKLDDPDQVADYRVPMSIGEGHAEVDNRGTGCVAYDVIINPGFLHTINNSKLFFGFFTSVVFEGMEGKYPGVKLERNWVLLKNKKFVGKIREQNLRSKTLVQEISKPQFVEVKSKKPEFKVIREPVKGHPEFLIAEVKLPGVKSSRSIIVDVGEDRLVVCTRPKQFELDIYLPFDLVQEECGSQFDINSNILTITMPVKPLK